MVLYPKVFNIISNDKLLQRYFKKRHLTQRSQERYIYVMSLYYRVTGLTPTQAIDEADEDEEARIRLRRRRVVKRLEDFEDHLEEKYGENTIRNCMAFVKSFYRFNKIIELPLSNRRRNQAKDELDVSKLPNSDDIKKAISFSSVKYQAIIVLLASTGMRQGDLRRLSLKHLITALNKYVKLSIEDFQDIKNLRSSLPNNIGPLRWDFCMQKGRRNITTFSTPESLDFLLNYLESDSPELKPDTPLFPGKSGGRITRQSINHYFKSLDNQCKFPECKPIYFRPHNLRKWFANQLKKTELGYTETRILLGHRVMDDTGSRYLVPDYDDLYNKYYRNMDTVTLYNKVEVHDITDERVKELEAREHEREKRYQKLAKELDMIKAQWEVETK